MSIWTGSDSLSQETSRRARCFELNMLADFAMSRGLKIFFKPKPPFPIFSVYTDRKVLFFLSVSIKFPSCTKQKRVFPQQRAWQRHVINAKHLIAMRRQARKSSLIKSQSCGNGASLINLQLDSHGGGRLRKALRRASRWSFAVGKETLRENWRKSRNRNRNREDCEQLNCFGARSYMNHFVRELKPFISRWGKQAEIITDEAVIILNFLRFFALSMILEATARVSKRGDVSFRANQKDKKWSALRIKGKTNEHSDDDGIWVFFNH